MKRLFTLLICLFASPSFSQTTLVLQPDPTTGKDAKLWSNNASNNYGNDNEFIAATWTFGGTPGSLRSLIEFDLTTIPSNATITNAMLTLYYGASTGSAGQSGTNAALLQRVTSSWSESTVTWNTQPSVTTANQITLATSTSSNQSYPDINVLSLVQDMISDPGGSHGFMLKLESEQPMASMKFYSSDASDAAQRPKLSITYTVDTTVECMTLNPGPADGVDAYIWSNNPNNNYGDIEDYIAADWTWGGDEGTLRSVMKFDLSTLPTNTVVQSANLSLYYNPTSTTNGQEGDNAATLQRIITSWDESEVTWNNQPAVTTVNQVTLAASTSLTQDYTNINVTQLLQDMISDPTNSFGFMMKLVTEETYRSIKFASSDYSDASKRPKLEICYNIVDGITTTKAFDFSVNPSIGSCNFYVTMPNSNSIATIDVMDVAGRVVSSMSVAPFSTRVNLFLDELNPGMYFIRVSSGNKTSTQKIVLTDN